MCKIKTAVQCKIQPALPTESRIPTTLVPAAPPRPPRTRVITLGHVEYPKTAVECKIKTAVECKIKDGVWWLAAFRCVVAPSGVTRVSQQTRAGPTGETNLLRSPCTDRPTFELPNRATRSFGSMSPPEASRATAARWRDTPSHSSGTGRSSVRSGHRLRSHMLACGCIDGGPG